MDMKISGVGTLGCGEYENVHISGSCKSEGLIRCRELHVSGLLNGESFECSEEAHLSGRGKFSGNLSAKELHVSGAVTCLGNITATEKVLLSGMVTCEKNIKTYDLRSSGYTKINGDLEAESVVISGGIQCNGLLNAENIHIKLDGSCKNEIGSIGCAKIKVEKVFVKPNFFKKLLGDNTFTFNVRENIEGDEVELQSTVAKAVVGRTVIIGDDCKIDTLQYSESCEISPKATVNRIEKI